MVYTRLSFDELQRDVDVEWVRWCDERIVFWAGQSLSASGSARSVAVANLVRFRKLRFLPPNPPSR